MHMSMGKTVHSLKNYAFSRSIALKQVESFNALKISKEVCEQLI